MRVARTDPAGRVAATKAAVKDGGLGPQRERKGDRALEGEVEAQFDGTPTPGRTLPLPGDSATRCHRGR